jgi:hypothetical protein
MAIAQKQAPKEKNDAEAVFDELPARYGVILPTGSALDGRLRFEDFNSNKVHSFQLSNVPAAKKETLANEIAENLRKALSEYDPARKDSTFVVTSVGYEPKGGVLTFSLKLAELPPLLAKK